MSCADDAKNIIKSNVSPVQAIEFYTGQRSRRGKYLCPFHNDHEPSLSVKGSRWRCWSCNAAGDVFDFVQRYFSIGFQEAMQKLNDDFHLGIRFKNEPVTDPLEKLWKLIERDVRQHNRNEIDNHRAEIDAEINELIAAHRALFQAGADESILRQYADEIDALIQYRERI